jgi:hypothetical protein
MCVYLVIFSTSKNHKKLTLFYEMLTFYNYLLVEWMGVRKLRCESWGQIFWSDETFSVSDRGDTHRKIYCIGAWLNFLNGQQTQTTTKTKFSFISDWIDSFHSSKNIATILILILQWEVKLNE